MATKKTRPKASVDANRYPVLAARLYDVGALVTDPRNAMEHDQRNIDVIKASLKKYGQRKNIVIAEDGTVKAGNGTLEAARQLVKRWELLTSKTARRTGLAPARRGKMHA